MKFYCYSILFHVVINNRDQMLFQCPLYVNLHLFVNNFNFPTYCKINYYIPVIKFQIFV